jgi:hypothetical protein
MIPTRAVLRRRGFARFELGTFPTPGVLPFAALLWLGLFAFIVAVTFAVDRWGDVETSAWAQASQPIRWGVLFLGVWVVQNYLAAYIAHGVTRRSFAQRTAVFSLSLAALVAALSTLGFVVEGWIYDRRGWDQAISDGHLFADADHLPTIFGTYFLVFLLWCAVGVLNAVAFYRHDGGWGLVTVPVSALVVTVSEASLDGTYPGFVVEVAGFLEDIATPVAVALSAAGIAVVAGLTWALLRDIPVRPRSS